MHPSFDYYVIAYQNMARSDFFLFYLIYYVTAPQLIMLVGASITAVTFILVVLAFKNQVTSAQNIQKTHSLA